MANPAAAQLFGNLMGGTNEVDLAAGEDGIDIARMMASAPIGRMTSMGGQITAEQLDQLLSAVSNAAIHRGQPSAALEAKKLINEHSADRHILS